VIASRRDRPGNRHRNFLTGAFHLLLRMLLGFDARGLDGIFVIRGDLLRGLPLRSSTGLVNLETLMRCSRLGLPIAHGVMHVSPRLSGRSKVANLRTMMRLFGEIVALRAAMAEEETAARQPPAWRR